MLKASHFSAGFIAVLVGYTSSVAIVLQAAQAVGANPAQQNSWLLVLGVGMGITSFGFSWWYKQPILTAWSTPGAALLASNSDEIGIAVATGAFLFSSALIVLVGISGWFERGMNKLPIALGAAMLAGVLLPFGLNVFFSFEAQPLLIGLMLLVWLCGQVAWPRYNIPTVLLAGIFYCYFADQLNLHNVEISWTTPVWVEPRFEWSALLGVGLPLFVVTMASQNLPGIATLRVSGYQPAVSPLISWTGIGSALLSPFGGYALNLAAITAAICAGPEADEDETQRYKSAMIAGALYVLMGLLGSTVVALFAAFPQELVLAIAGLALFGTIANSLHMALDQSDTREAALVTFLVTFSGISPLGIGSAFWGLLAGGLLMQVSKSLTTTN
ncbi:MAG: benzoate/H(+) symporter BenE family transporter [Granulosicoccaceae bacterium]